MGIYHDFARDAALWNSALHTISALWIEPSRQCLGTIINLMLSIFWGPWFMKLNFYLQKIKKMKFCLRYLRDGLSKTRFRDYKGL